MDIAAKNADSPSAEIQAIPFFSAAILDLQLNGTVYKVVNNTIKKFDPENMGVAAGISFLSALQLEIHLGVRVILPPSHCIIRM